MLRTFVLALTLIGTPALAAPHYRAEPAAKPAKGRLVAKDVVWTCGDTVCLASTSSNRRPALVCAALAKQVGRLQSFSAGSQDLAAEELDRCNLGVK